MKMNNTPTGVASSTVETYCTPNNRSIASRITAMDITSGVPTRNQRCTYTSICSQRLERLPYISRMMLTSVNSARATTTSRSAR